MGRSSTPAGLDQDPGGPGPEPKAPLQSSHERRGRKVLGVEFAPFAVPLERRLQTFAVTSWILTFFLMGPMSLGFLIYLFLYTRFSFVPVLYFIWYIFDRETCSQGGRLIPWVRNWRLWKWYCEYFPIHLVKTAELDPTKNYLFGSHPHGILSSAAFGNFATEGTAFSKVFPGVTPHLLTLEGHYSFPFYREYLMSSGACSVSRKSIDNILSKEGGGHVAVLVVGGAVEALQSCKDTYILKLKDRKGFIKAALRNGASLVPIFSFGEIDIYTQVHFPDGSRRKRLQDRLRHIIGLAPCLFNGRGIFQYSFGIIPQRRPLTTVVGTPIPVEKNDKPSPEEIDNLLQIYIKELETLFYTFRDQYATSPSSDLKII